MKKKKIFLLVFGILFLGIVIAGYFMQDKILGGSAEAPENSGNGGSGGGSQTSGTDTTIDEQDVNRLMTSLEASSLHNPVLSGNTPKIVVKADENYFTTEVVKGVVRTTKGSIDDEDLMIITTNQEIYNAITSDNTLECIKESISSGETSIEMKASQLTLFSKGYLSLYQSLTGEDIS